MVRSLRCLSFACIAGLATLVAAENAVAAVDAVGQIAPALVVRQLDGRELDLTALRGKVVILNVWATWCSPCRAELPMLSAFSQKHQSEGVVLVGLSADDVRDRKDVEKVARGLAYPVALLQEAKANDFGMPRALPITYVIDTQGIIRARLMPTRAGISEQDLAAAVQPLISQAGEPRAP